MGSDVGKKIGAVGRVDGWSLPPEKIRIAQEDPKHPHHDYHMARVALDNPEFQALLSSIRTLGWETGSICFYYRDPPGAEEATAATAKRRVTAARIVNREWKKSKDPRYPIVVPVIRTDDPIMAENIENSVAKAADPPLVLARRFLAASKTMGEASAAASIGLELAQAHNLVKALSLPEELQAQINARELPVDVALRTGRNGQAQARAILKEAETEAKNAATDPKTGAVDEVKAKATKRAKVERAAAEMPKRPMTMPAKKIHAWIDELQRMGNAPAAALAVLRHVAPRNDEDKRVLDGFSRLRNAIDSAGELK